MLTENLHTWYIGGADSESRLSFLKFWHQNLFLGKFRPKNSKLPVLSENLCTQYLKDADYESRLRFLKFWPQNPLLGKFGSKNSKLSVFSENWYSWYLKDADSYSNNSFLNSDLKSIFGKIWTKKVKVVQSGWKLAHRVSRQCSFLFWHYFSQFPILNHFLNKFGSKNSKLFILTKNWHTWYVKDADSYSDNIFLNCKPKIHFWANFGWKSQSCLFCLKISTHADTHTQYLEDVDSYFDISFLQFQT